MVARAQVLLQTCRAVHWTQPNACTGGRDERRGIQHNGNQVRSLGLQRSCKLPAQPQLSTV